MPEESMEEVQESEAPGKQKHFAKRALHLFGRNWICAFLFEIIYKTVVFLAISPLVAGLLYLTMKTSGVAYIADYNVSRILTNPLGWIFLIVILMLLAFYVVFEMCGLVILYEASREDRSLSVWELTALAAKQAWRIWRPRNLAMIPFILILVPLTNAGLTSGFISQIHIPEFIADYIAENTVLFIAEVILAIFLFIFVFLRSFSVHYFTLYGQSFNQSLGSSRELIRRNWGKLFGHLLLMSLIFMVIEVLGSVTMGMLLASTIPLPADPTVGQLAAFFGAAAGIAVFSGVCACFSAPLTYAIISQVFYDLLAKKGQEMPESLQGHTLTVPQHRRHLAAFWITATLVMGVIVSIVFLVSYAIDIDPSQLSQLAGKQSCAVLAHRGASDAYPENTMPAFKAAIDEGADWIELDVQQTKDGVLVVSHDASLKRTTGVDKDFYQVTWDEIKGLDAGSWFSPDFSYVRISKLEDVLELAKDSDIKLNIELKPDGHDAERDDPNNTLEKAAVKLVRTYIDEYDMGDRIALASIKYDCLERVKEIDPSITTIYDMTLAYGDIASDDVVDIYSVDEAFVTQALVKDVHDGGKTIFAWTVNDEDNMAKMYSYGVDGLVTDRLTEAHDVIVENGISYIDLKQQISNAQ